MKRDRYREEIGGPTATAGAITYRPIASYASTTYRFRSVGLFKSIGRPLRIEAQDGDGSVTQVPIRDLHSMAMGALLVFSVVFWILAAIGRRGS